MMDSKGAITLGTKGPHDDFFCHKYQVWYRVEDCVYRIRNKTYTGCVNCFQGRLNLRYIEKGAQPPVCLTSDPVPTAPESSLLRTSRPTT